VDYDPFVDPMAWTMSPLCCSMVASMAWTMWCFYGLNYVFAYACFYDTSMDHYTFHIRWFLAWFGSASVAITWGWNLAGVKEWFGSCVAASDVQLWECTIFLWMTKPIYSFRAQLPL
jgi:hypothetical protein